MKGTEQQICSFFIKSYFQTIARHRARFCSYNIDICSFSSVMIHLVVFINSRSICISINNFPLNKYTLKSKPHNFPTIHFFGYVWSRKYKTLCSKTIIKKWSLPYHLLFSITVIYQQHE